MQQNQNFTTAQEPWLGFVFDNMFMDTVWNVLLKTTLIL